jgi:hypothetical protein
MREDENNSWGLNTIERNAENEQEKGTGLTTRHYERYEKPPASLRASG